MAAGMVTSLESSLDKQLADLIEKLVLGTATPAERQEIARLTKQRSMLMYPPNVSPPSLPANWRRNKIVAA